MCKGGLAKPITELKLMVILSATHIELPVVNLRKLRKSSAPMFPINDFKYSKTLSSARLAQNASNKPNTLSGVATKESFNCLMPLTPKPFQNSLLLGNSRIDQ